MRVGLPATNSRLPKEPPVTFGEYDATLRSWSVSRTYQSPHPLKATGIVWNRTRKMIFGRWRPVAFFSTGTYEVRTTIVDALMAEGRGEKGPGDHPWQQTVGPFSRLVEMSARPGELVVDPFLGSGTTALACLATGRRFLGCDVDPGAVSLALERIASYERGEIDLGAPVAEIAGEEAIDAETGA